MTSTTWSDAGSDGRYSYQATALSVFWPEAQYRAALARWPAGHTSSTRWVPPGMRTA